MSYDKETNQWKNTTPLLREKTPYKVKNPNEMTDVELLDDAAKEAKVSVKTKTVRKASKKSKGEHYVDNKVFLQAMVAWKDKCKEVDEADERIPPVTNYIGECFLKIATHLSYRPNFINYTYKDDMISDGIENCLQYASNFNPEKSSNPFAYFTQIIYYAFIRRIQKEKKQTHVKNKIIEGSNYQSYDTMPGDSTTYNIDNSFAMENLPKEDVYKPKKTEKKTKRGLENFMEDDNNSLGGRF